LRIAGEKRLIAAEDAARYRDALGFRCRRDWPQRCLSRWNIRCWSWCGGMRARMGRSRCALPRSDLLSIQLWSENALRQLLAEGRVLEGGFLPGGLHREWCDAEMLRLIRRKSLARLRREVEPVEQHTLARFLTHWQGLLMPRRTGHANLDGCWTRSKACRAHRCRHRCWRRRFCRRALRSMRRLASTR
jgi:ATP-dependent Lhr-like helicase